MIAPPFVGTSSAGHCALLHVGSALDHVPVDETPVCAHASAIVDERKNPALHANAALDPWLSKSVLLARLPSEGAVSVGQTARAQEGSLPLHDPLLLPAASCAHVRASVDESAYPASHAYVATEPCSFVFVSSGTLPFSSAVLKSGHVASAHVGALPLHAPTLVVPVWLHVSVALSDREYPLAQSNVAVDPSSRELLNATAPFAGAVSSGHCASVHVGAAPLHVPTPVAAV